MVINNTITKKYLEDLITKIFYKVGYVKTSFLLDSLKFLGFKYATNSGISVSIEDLKSPKIKKDLIDRTNNKIRKISFNWVEGVISETERFQNILSNWNNSTEYLKNKIIDSFKKLNPVNTLYIMAFSGARGNISQVRQLIGMRGLMSDQDGKIIDLPIKTNFREGLSSVDYIVSSYGARKGIVDTALKTAVSGYLTRRLIYAAKDSIIRIVDCNTKDGILVFFNSKNNYNKYLGYYLNDIIFKNDNNENIILKKNIFIDKNVLKELKKYGTLILNIRTVLSCNSNNLICQKCYGWDLSKNKPISIGEAVGIIAAQSIGEPGTQLTMRTFHTGGVFTTSSLEKKIALFSGKIIIPKLLELFEYRTNQGNLLYKTKQDIVLNVINWKGNIQNINLNSGSLVHFNKSCFVKKSQLLAENSLKESLSKSRKIKSILSTISGEIDYNELNYHNKKDLKITKENGYLYIKSGTIMILPKNIEYKFPLFFNIYKSFGSLNITSPINGYIEINSNKSINIFNLNKKLKLLIDLKSYDYENYYININILVKNYQYIEKNTILCRLEFYPKLNTRIYKIRKKESFNNKALLFITEDHISKSYKNSDNNKNDLNLIKKDGFRSIFHKLNTIFLKEGSIINYCNNTFINKDDVICYLINFVDENKDITQGLPKIDDLIEARSPINSNIILYTPSVLNSSSLFNTILFKKYINNILYLKFKSNNLYFSKNIIYLFSNSYNNYFIKYNINNFKNIQPYIGSFIYPFDSIISGNINPHKLLKTLFKYYMLLDGLNIGIKKSLNKFKLIFINSIQAIYQSQGVYISSKHLEIIIKNMTSKAIIKNRGNTYFLPGELIKINFLNEVFNIYNTNNKLYDMAIYEPKFLSIKLFSINSESFLSNASFQETKKVLTKAAIEGSKDWLLGLKESIIVGKNIPAGSAFINYKNYLDNIFKFKD